MLITVVCPGCKNRYQVQPTLVGQRMRCPKAECRKIFVVSNGEVEKPRPADNPPPESRRPAPGKAQRTGAVGDMVPILPAEESRGPEEPPPSRPQPKRTSEQSTPSWKDAPPPVRKSSGEKSPAVRRKDEPSPLPDTPVDNDAAIQAQSWDAPPPVRRGKETAATEEPDTPEPEEEKRSYTPPPRRSRGKAYVAIAFLLVLVVAGLAFAWFHVYRGKEAEKEQSYQEALDVYKKGGFRESANKFKQMAQELPDGSRKDECLFYASLALLRDELEAVPPAGTDRLDHGADGLTKLSQFIKDHQKDKKLLEDVGHDLGVSLGKVVGYFTEGFTDAADEKPLALVEQAVSVKEEVGNLKESLTDDELAKIDADLDKVRTAVARWKRKGDVYATVRALLNQPPNEGIKKYTHLVSKEEDEFKGLGQDPAVVEIKNKLYEAHYDAVTYKLINADLERPSAKDVPVPALAVLPFVRGQSVPAGGGLDMVMARGVLYALERGTGQYRWAMRIGLDGNTVPMRLPDTTARAGRDASWSCPKTRPWCRSWTTAARFSGIMVLASRAWANRS